MLAREYVLPQHAHWRVQVPHEPRDNRLCLQISTPGSDLGEAEATGDESSVAEIFGTELLPQRLYTFSSGTSVEVYAIRSCILKVEAIPSVLNEAYVASSLGTTISSVYAKSTLDIHTYLNSKRASAARSGPEVSGPRVLICGYGHDTGKTSLARTLLNYAARSGYHPLHLDVDSYSPLSSFPDCVSLGCVQYPFDPEECCVFTPHQLCLYYGSQTMSKNFTLLRHVVARAMEMGEQRAARHKRCRLGGLIVDLPSLPHDDDDEKLQESNGKGSERRSNGSPSLAFLMHVIHECSIDTVIVVGSDRLRLRIHQACCDEAPNLNYTNQGVTAATTANGTELRLISIEQSPGAVDRVPEERALQQKQRWTSYFIGSPASPICCTKHTLPLSHVRFVQFGTVTAEAMQGLLPLDDTTEEESATVQYVDMGSKDLRHSVVGISNTFFLQRDVATAAPPQGGDSPSPTLQGGFAVREIPHDEVEKGLKRCLVVGFALVLSISATVGSSSGSVVLWAPFEQLPNNGIGLCLFVGDSTLQTK